MAKSRRQPGGQVIEHLDSAKTAPHCKGFVRAQLNCLQFSGRRKRLPNRFGCSINPRSGLFDGFFDRDRLAAGLMILCRFRRLGVWRPRPRDQRRENRIPEAYDYLDHRATPYPRVVRRLSPCIKAKVRHVAGNTKLLGDGAGDRASPECLD